MVCYIRLTYNSGLEGDWFCAMASTPLILIDANEIAICVANMLRGRLATEKKLILLEEIANNGIKNTGLSSKSASLCLPTAIDNEPGSL